MFHGLQTTENCLILRNTQQKEGRNKHSLLDNRPIETISTSEPSVEHLREKIGGC